MAHVRCHVSHVRCHMSGVTCKVSCVTCNIKNKIGQSDWASRWRVCYQQGLPRLVFRLSGNFVWIFHQIWPSRGGPLWHWPKRVIQKYARGWGKKSPPFRSSANVSYVANKLWLCYKCYQYLILTEWNKEQESIWWKSVISTILSQFQICCNTRILSGIL